jgi:hypothetical protein
MDYTKIIDDLINYKIEAPIEEIRQYKIKYNNKTMDFDTFVKEYQLKNDPVEFYENLIERDYIFDSSHFAYYINNAYIDSNDLIDWYRRVQRIRVS